MTNLFDWKTSIYADIIDKWHSPYGIHGFLFGWFSFFNLPVMNWFPDTAYKVKALLPLGESEITHLTVPAVPPEYADMVLLVGTNISYLYKPTRFFLTPKNPDHWEWNSEIFASITFSPIKFKEFQENREILIRVSGFGKEAIASIPEMGMYRDSTLPPSNYLITLSKNVALQTDAVIKVRMWKKVSNLLELAGVVATLNPKYKPLLDSIVEISHTDRIGGTFYNQLLSEKRASAVKEYLLAKFGIKRERVMVETYSIFDPTGKGLSKDRRL